MDEHPPALMTAPATDPATLRIQLLGAFTVSIDGRQVSDGAWRLSKARSLIKLLALSPGQQLHRDQVIDLFWPDLDPAAANNNLHQALHAGRRALASIMPGGQETPLLHLQRQVLALAPPTPLWIDANAFEVAARAALTSDDPTAGYAALDLYSGELLPEDLYEDWTIEQREALREQHLQVLQRVAALHDARQEYTPAIDALRRAIAIDPAREHVTVGLMRLYALTGRGQQALRLYQRLEVALAEEFDAEPSNETQRLYRAILDRRYPTAEQVAPRAERPAVLAPPQRAPAMPERRLSPFVDRVHELAQVVAGLDEAMAGRGQAILLTGEPGIGKTRLAEEAVRIAREGGAVGLWGRCYEGDGAPAYWPWVQIIRSYAAGAPTEMLREDMGAGAADIALVVPELRQLLPDLPALPALDPEQARFRLFDGVTSFLARAAARRPLVIVLDDLHWADRSSLLLLEFLADSLRRLPLLLVGTYRDVKTDRRHPLTHTLAHFSQREIVRRIELRGFGHDDVARFSEVTAGHAAPPGLLEVIYAQTEGNPFYVREIVRLLADEGRLGGDGVGSWSMTIPQGVRETITLRLDRLSNAASRVLTIASVIGREFSLPVLERVCNLPALETLELVEEGLAAGTLTESVSRAGVFRFSHALIHQTLYEATSRVRRLELHRRIAGAIEDLYAANLTPWLDALAWHYFQAAPAGGNAKAIEYLALAGAQALDQLAWSEAANDFTRALELLDAEPGPVDERRCELLLSLGDALNSLSTGSGDSPEARAVFLRAASIARMLGLPQQLARAAIGSRGHSLAIAFGGARTLDLLEEALSALGEGDSVLRCQTLSHLAGYLPSLTASSPDIDADAHARMLDRSRRLHAEAVAMARRLSDPQTLATALLGQVSHFPPDNLRDLCHDARQVVEHAALANAVVAQFKGLERLLDALLQSADRAGADSVRAQLAALAARYRLPVLEWDHATVEALLTMIDGRLADADDLVRSAGQRAQTRTWTSLNHLFVLCRLRGSFDPDLWPRIVESLTWEPPLALGRLNAALYLLETGDEAAAREHFTALARHDFRDWIKEGGWTQQLALAAEVSSWLGDRARSALLYELLLPYADRCIANAWVTAYHGAAAFYLGLLATTLERWDDAAQHFERAIELDTANRARPFVANARYHYAEMLLQRAAPGDREQALGLLDQALVEAGAMGMTSVAERVPALQARAQGILPL